MFHLDRGYYYFSNVENRILIGGGRNLDFKTESTTDFGETKLIQKSLKKILNTIVLTDKKYEIDFLEWYNGRRK